MVEILDLELIVKKIKTIGYFFGGACFRFVGVFTVFYITKPRFVEVISNKE